MRKTGTMIGALLLCAAAAGADAPTSLTPHEAEYKVRVSGIGGRLTTRLAPRDDGLEATHVVEPTGFIGLFARGDIRERSYFADPGAGLLPIAYESRNTLGEDSGATLEFDWDDRRVTGMHYEDGERSTVDRALDRPLFDRISIQYRLMQDLARGRDIAELADPAGDAGDPAGDDGAPAAAGADYVLFDGDETRALQIAKTGERRIRTGAGTFDTIGVQHQKQGSSRRTLLWLAPELDYLPVLIEQYRHDELKVRATLREYRPLDD